MAVARPDGSRIPLGNKRRGARGLGAPVQAAAPRGFQGRAGRFAPFTGQGAGSTARGFQPAQRQTTAVSPFAYRATQADAPRLVAPALKAEPLGLALGHRRGQAQGMSRKAAIINAKRRGRR